MWFRLKKCDKGRGRVDTLIRFVSAVLQTTVIFDYPKIFVKCSNSEAVENIYTKCDILGISSFNLNGES